MHGAVGPIAEEWDELADRTGAPPFVRPGWTSAWWTAFGGGRLEILALRRDSRLAAAVALKRVGRNLAVTANWHTPASDVLAEDASAAGELADAVFALPSRRVTLVFADPSSPILAACCASARAAGFHSVVRPRERSPFVEIDGGFAGYEHSIDRSLRANLRRRRRRLEEQGVLEIDLVEGGTRLDGALVDGFSVEGSGWKTERGTAIASHASTRRFYTDIARWAAERGWLQLAFLRLEGRPLAFHYNLLHGGVLFHLKGGYDPSFARYSPSKLLHHEMISRAFEAGLQSYEFLGDDEPWKQEWTATFRERRLLEAFSSTPGGLVDWAVHVVGRPAFERVRAAQRFASTRLRSPA